MKRCKIAPPSCLCPGNPCCTGCKVQDCPARCENRPEQCGCWEEGPPPRSRARGKGGGRYLDWDEIARLRGLGVTIAEIAERMGCSDCAVTRALRRMEVTKGDGSI